MRSSVIPITLRATGHVNYFEEASKLSFDIEFCKFSAETLLRGSYNKICAPSLHNNNNNNNKRSRMKLKFLSRK